METKQTRKPNFGLKTLLAVVLMSALGCAFVWEFLPWYRIQEERRAVKAAAKQLETGMTCLNVREIFGDVLYSSFRGGGGENRTLATVPIIKKHDWYMVRMLLDSTDEKFCSSMPSTKIAIYRIPVPAEFLDLDHSFKDKKASHKTKEHQAIDNFFDVLCSRESEHSFDSQFEVIPHGSNSQP